MMRFAVALGGVVLVLVLAGCGSALIRVSDDRTPATEQPAHPVREKGEVATLEPNHFHAWCRDFEGSTEPQRAAYLCWAACAAMIHAYRGEPIDQEEIAARILNAGEEIPEDRRDDAIWAAGKYEVMLALNPDLEVAPGKTVSDALNDAIRRIKDWEDMRGMNIRFTPWNWLRSRFDRLTANGTDILVRDISSGQPVVAGLRDDKESDYGHAYIVYGIEYSREREGPEVDLNELARKMNNESWLTRTISYLFGRMVQYHSIRRVYLFDPWDGTPIEMTAQDFKERMDFIISRPESREILVNEWKFIEVGSESDAEPPALEIGA